MKSSGFSLIETLIYTALLAGLCIVAFSWVSNGMQSFAKINKKSEQVMLAQAILFRLAQDVQMADPMQTRWHCQDGQLSLYHINAHITWAKEKDKLYRIQNKSKTLVGTQVEQFTHKLIKNGAHIKGIECTLAFGDVSFSHAIRVYNG